MAIGKAIEEELGKRQGQRTDLVNEGQTELFESQLRRNCDEVIGRTDEIAADKAGFGNRKTYQQAKTVTDKAVPSA